MQGVTKLERLLKKQEFDLVYKTGRRLFSKHFSITFLKSPRKRIGFSISSKVGGAVVRNRIRRVIREMFRNNIDLFPHGDCVIWAKTGAAKLNRPEIREEISALAKNVNK